MLPEVKIWHQKGRIGKERRLVGSAVEALVLYFPLFLELFCFLKTSFTQSLGLGLSRPNQSAASLFWGRLALGEFYLILWFGCSFGAATSEVGEGFSRTLSSGGFAWLLKRHQGD